MSLNNPSPLDLYLHGLITVEQCVALNYKPSLLDPLMSLFCVFVFGAGGISSPIWPGGLILLFTLTILFWGLVPQFSRYLEDRKTYNNAIAAYEKARVLWLAEMETINEA